MSWLRERLRRPVALLAGAVLIAVAFSALWLARVTVPYTKDPEPTPQDQTAHTPGAGFTLRGMTTVEVVPQVSGADSPVPGAAFVAVVFDYAGEPGVDVACEVHLLGADRTWTRDTQSWVKDWGYQSFCEGSSGTVLKFFQVPATAVPEVHGIRIWGNGGDIILAGEVKVQ